LKVLTGQFIIIIFTAISISFGAVKQKVLKTNIPTTITNRPARDFRIHDLGNLSTIVTNYGSYGDNESGMFSMEWPAQSGAYYLWNGSLWIGATVDGERLCSGNSFGRIEFNPSEGHNFSFGPEKSAQDHLVVYDDMLEVRGHTPMGIQIWERGLTWNIPGYDEIIIYEYEIHNAGDNVLDDLFIGWMYDSDVASSLENDENNYSFMDDLVDYDGFDWDESKTDIADWVDPNDLDKNGKTGYDEWGWPFGYALLKDGSATNPNYNPAAIEPDGFYDEWTVILNDSGPVLYWQTSTNPAKAPVGSSAKINGNELRGWLVPRNTSLMFDADYPQTSVVDLGERQKPTPTPGIIGGRLIYSDIIKNEKAFPYLETTDDTFLRPFAHMWWNWESGPRNDNMRYAYLNGTHAGATRLGKKYKFMPSPFDLNAPTFDYRWLTSTGPFDKFPPGDVIRVVYAASVGKGWQGLRENLDNALAAYYSGSKNSSPYNPSAPDEDYHYFLSAPPQSPVVEYTPLDGGVRLVWDNSAETTTDPILGHVDFQGYKVYRAAFEPRNWELVAAFDNVDETVWVRDTNGSIINPKLDPETGIMVSFKNPKWQLLENSHFVKMDLPPIVNHYDDFGGEFLGKQVQHPINGMAYFYTIVAYDFDKPPTKISPKLLSQESAKENYMRQEETNYALPVVPVKMYTINDFGSFDLQNIKVVPNPYKGTALYESRFEDRIEFTNLPPACKITIFTLVGDMIDTIYHQDGTDAVSWDMISRNRQRIKSGLYVYVVEVDQQVYEKFIGKFAVLR
jgi:hypothetical protein